MQNSRSTSAVLHELRYTLALMLLFLPRMALKTLSYLCVLSGSVVSDFLWSHEPSRQDYWSGLPLPTPGDLPDPGIKPTSLDFAYVTDNQNIAKPQKECEQNVIHRRIFCSLQITLLHPWRWFFLPQEKPWTLASVKALLTKEITWPLYFSSLYIT